MNRRTIRITCASIAAVSIGIAMPAWAQEAAQSAPPNGTAENTALSPDQSAMQQGDIIVTAMKRSESALRVPAAISVVGGGDLKTAGVNNVNDLQNLVPGVNIGTGTFGTNISIRGVTSTDQTSKGELGIAYNINGVFVGRGQEQGLAYFDINRIEVLRGPQGTLYGRSSTGGAINVITNKPELGKFSGYGKFELGNYNTERAEGAINIPLGKTLAFRAAGAVNHRDGFLTPVDFSSTVNGTTYDISADGQKAKNDQIDQTGRFSLLFQPSSAFTATAIATVGHQGGVGPGSAVYDFLRDNSGSARYDVLADPVPAFQDNNFFNIDGLVNVQLGGAQLDLQGSHQHFTDHTQVTSNNNPIANTNGPAAAGFALDDYQGTFNTTQFEARLSNVNPGVIDYVVGANYYLEKIHESDHNWVAPIDSYDDTTTWLNAIDPLNTTTHKSYGVFGQATWHVTDKLGIVGGLRYSHDETTRVGTFAVPFFNPATGGPWLDQSGNPCVYPNDCVGNPNNGHETDSKLTYRVGVNYQATPSDLIYATVATGFKAGGFNDFDPATGTTGAYGPESLTAYEIGYKGRPLPGLTLSSSAFYYDYTADQINGLVFFGPVGVLFTQLAPAKIYGWENEISYHVARNTDVSGSFSLMGSKFKHLMVGPSYPYQFDFSGQELDRVPHFNATFALNHYFPLANGSEIRFRGAIKYNSGYYLSDLSHAVRYRQNAFTRSDMSVTYALPEDRITVQLFVENIENKVQKTSGPNSYLGINGGPNGDFVPSAEGTVAGFPANSVTFGVSTPRFYGVRLGVKF